jgi:predicted phage tail protein
MLTKVILEGAMGKHFGKEWLLEVSSVAEAIRMIEANKPGFLRWIKDNLGKHSHYRVVCKTKDKEEDIVDEMLPLIRQVQEIRIVPLVGGAGRGALQIVAGIALIAVGVVTQNPGLITAGVSIGLGGVIASLTKIPTNTPQEQQERKDKTSYYFNGPVNTTQQGSPVQLIYGRCLVGSQVISAAVTIDQLL